MEPIVDTHAHLDVKEFAVDLPDVVVRAKAAGVGKILIPAVDLAGLDRVFEVCHHYQGYCYPMIGLQPEEVRNDWQKVLKAMRIRLDECMAQRQRHAENGKVVAIGECGLDFYWSREFEEQQLLAFEEQVRWSVETGLPLMIHCRKAQNELLKILRKYERQLHGGVFHCFTGNPKEAAEFLKFDGFVLGIGGVVTFKSSHLREDLPASVPLNRIVLETDSPYMAPVPHRGKRNESAFIYEVLTTLATAYGVSVEEVARITNENVTRIFKEL